MYVCYMLFNKYSILNTMGMYDSLIYENICLGSRVVSASDCGVKDPGSNRTADGCVYRDSCCAMQPWARAVHLYRSA